MRAPKETAQALISFSQARQTVPNDFFSNHYVRENRYDEMRPLVERVHNDETFKLALLQIVSHSSNDSTLATAAANAITILNGAAVSFAAMELRKFGIEHWRGIRIPGADLRYAVMCGGLSYNLISV